jgi:plastocyanin
MRRFVLVSAGLLSFTLLVSPSNVPAGQVRVTVSNNFFSPRAINCNAGDHVVWVWAGGMTHTCTSGDSDTATPNGIWDAGAQSAAGASFTWKSTGTGTFLYYCLPHSPLMAGRVIAAGSGIAVADFRITEVLYNAPTGTHLIEIANKGTGPGDLGVYRLSVQAGVALTVPLTSVIVAPGGTVTVHVHASGTSNATDLFLPTMPDLASPGAAALYVPNTKVTSLADTKQIIDFVEWGASGGPNEATAQSAALWGGSEFVPDVAAGHSIEYCDIPLRRGASHWFDNPAPNFGGAADNCLVPVLPTTWGRLKTLYR